MSSVRPSPGSTASPLRSTTVAPFVDQGTAVTIDADNVVARGDRAALRQILVNLLSNAARHGGGDFVVAAFRDEGEAVVRVIDDGPGVADEMLFGRYLHGRGGALVKGSVGLGTAVANAYAEALGGTISYLREDDRTVFEVRLPAVAEEPAEAPAAVLV